MSKKMLIDASHPEETRVVIVDGTQVEELDFESRAKRQLRGNVYLARVTRVEPSLQAAFIEYGGNRHGFLAFSEIHPDYYQIPHEDKLKLLEAEEAENKAEEEAIEADVEKPKKKSKSKEDDADDDEAEAEADADEDIDAEDSDGEENDSDDNDSDEDEAATADEAEVVDEQAKVASSRRKRMSRRRYKIQEVIKRGQILLIQAVKEERGNKGAAMTTYLSLAGRYCVLMPNTPRGGGISRKIANGSDRKRLKAVMSELEVPQGMGVIVRTAGAKRTKAEIKRDYDYLSRLWSDIRETTLSSIAPALIHEEGNLVKRSIRDLYNKDIDEVLVQGDEAYKTAKAFIKMLMPSHAKNVKQYKDTVPLYLRYQVERQIEASLESVVQLRSGGYLVIHPTEALVSVDVNSGRSTKERNVERTALKTNLEAASEVARQMRLRDLAGLIVIDFIDMDENKNNRAVEKRMKDELSHDRARVQTSRISQFGLMEISRQRRRRSLLEGSTASCEHCDGVGRKRTIESSALRALRAVEELGVRGRANRIKLKVSKDVALYLINEKRDLLQHVDGEFDMFTELVGDEDLIRPAFEFEVTEAADNDNKDPLEEIEKEWKKEHQKRGNQKKKRNRGRKKSDDEDASDEDKGENKSRNKSGEDETGEPRKRRRRRGRRGGRNKRRDNETNEAVETPDTDEALKIITPDADETKPADDTPSDDKPKGRGRRRKAAPKKDRPKKDAPKEEAKEDAPAEAKEKPAPKTRSTARRKAPARKSAPECDEVKAPEEKGEEKTAKKPARKKAPPKKDSAKKAAAKKPAAKKAAAKKAPAKMKAPAKAKSAPKAKAQEAPKEEAPKDKAKARSTARRKAPARKPARDEAEKAPTKKPTAKKTPEKKPAAKKADTATKDAAPKKRGWWSRKT